VAGGAAAATRIKSLEVKSEIAPRLIMRFPLVVEKPASGTRVPSSCWVGDQQGLKTQPVPKTSPQRFI
jgi:hypothetical protein